MTCCPKRPNPVAEKQADSFLSAGKDAADRVMLPGGHFMMGTNEQIIRGDGEYPAKSVRLKAFEIDRYAVTNRRFARFVDDTGYETEAERFGWSYVFFHLLIRPDDYEPLPGLEWWRKVDGAFWRQPEGSKSDVEDRLDHPVVHISWNDAMAFASWAGGRLPTEAEWEYAALGGLPAARYPWGDEEPNDHSFMPCNIWQGEFPNHNTLADGYLGTAPAKSFQPNGFGLYNMVGNTWEWTGDLFRIKSLSRSLKARSADAQKAGERVVKGGSFLCHKSYCYRYRIAARTSNTPDTSLSHTGFRLSYDIA